MVRKLLTYEKIDFSSKKCDDKVYYKLRSIEDEPHPEPDATSVENNLKKTSDDCQSNSVKIHSVLMQTNLHSNAVVSDAWKDVNLPPIITEVLGPEYKTKEGLSHEVGKTAVGDQQQQLLKNTKGNSTHETDENGAGDPKVDSIHETDENTAGDQERLLLKNTKDYSTHHIDEKAAGDQEELLLKNTEGNSTHGTDENAAGDQEELLLKNTKGDSTHETDKNGAGDQEQLLLKSPKVDSKHETDGNATGAKQLLLKNTKEDAAHHTEENAAGEQEQVLLKNTKDGWTHHTDENTAEETAIDENLTGESGVRDSEQSLMANSTTASRAVVSSPTLGEHCLLYITFVVVMFCLFSGHKRSCICSGSQHDSDELHKLLVLHVAGSILEDDVVAAMWAYPQSSTTLRSSLSAENAWLVSALAGFHGDESLKRSAADFLWNRRLETFESEEWMDELERTVKSVHDELAHKMIREMKTEFW